MLRGSAIARKACRATRRIAAKAAPRQDTSSHAREGASRVGSRTANNLRLDGFCLLLGPRCYSSQAAVKAGTSQLRNGVSSIALFGVGAAGACGVWYFHFRPREATVNEEDTELPLVPEPAAHFVHPYEAWPWHRRAWFTLKRSLYLAWVFSPFFVASTCLVLFSADMKSGPWRGYWLETMLECTQRAGAAFQKFGQWLSMRPDMFPPDVIRTLAKLRSDAPSHSVDVSKQIVQAKLGQDMGVLFEEFQDEPIASGSVGQVHRARLREEFALDGPGGRLRDVAVKVQHPGVVDAAFMDLNIVWKVVQFTEKFLHMTVPFDRGEFDEVIQAQMDFQREAFNLQQFDRNFRGESRIRFPKVSPKLVTSDVLIETWADGKVISHILEDFDNSAPLGGDAAKSTAVVEKREIQGKLCSILYDMSMKMMFRDNFVHGDLHGGNILYSEADNHVTVLDAGIATSLQQQTLVPFGKFLHALCSGHTDGIVEYLQRFNESATVVNMAELRRDIQRTMDKYMGPFRKNPELPTNAADMFGEVMFSLQKHDMLLRGDVASTLYTICISEGLIRQLDPSFDVAKQSLPYIVKWGLGVPT